ncbi:auxin-responsive protein IAA33 [Vigna radiata var. radiata]|uniref:Auxin-induced protein n=1 Tax=Vigna radiata var. radiata TaxID=3916 RepID=A0A3Q0F125_VIGRR|nr:auxin-responsive protein IAA33 [Vigna radiata var. radiata]
MSNWNTGVEFPVGNTAASTSSSLAFNVGNTTTTTTNSNKKFQDFPGLEDDDLVSTVVPTVIVVLEGRSICHRISLHNHGSYQSLAKALREMFVENAGEIDDFDLPNVIPGYLIAYEDMENDLLLVGDLSWKDFVRVAKRIRIIPTKANSRKGSIGAT